MPCCGFLESVWTWRRGGSFPLQLSVSLQVTWFPPGFHNPPPPWIPRGEKVITIIALPWHGAKHPEVREKDHWNDDVSELIKKGLICVEQHNGELCRAYFIPCANEWKYIISARADFCVKYSPFVNWGSLSPTQMPARKTRINAFA